MGFVNEKAKDGKWRTIDYERNIILKHIGSSGPDWPIKFQINYSDTLITFEAFRKMRKAVNNLDDVTWDVVRLNIPNDMRKNEAEIIDAIAQALNVFGASSKQEGIDTVQVNFKTPEI